MRVCIVPARSGSKRIPRKNLREFRGKPMIAWSLETAAASGLFDHIVVSTDDHEIADIARDRGASVPFMRPAALAADDTPTRPVINHAITEIEHRFGPVRRVCCLYATAPFARAGDLREGLALLDADPELSFVFSAVSYAHPVQRAFVRGADGRLQMLYPQYSNTRSQDLPTAYHDAGQFYWGRPQAFLDNVDMFGPAATILPIPAYRAVDIDTPEDWKRALILHELMDSPAWKG